MQKFNQLVELFKEIEDEFYRIFESHYERFSPLVQKIFELIEDFDLEKRLISISVIADILADAITCEICKDFIKVELIEESNQKFQVH